MTCAKLSNYFECVSLPKWLFTAPQNHFVLFYLLEIFNNQLVYQWEGSASLVVNLLRIQDVVKRLEGLEVPEVVVPDVPEAVDREVSEVVCLEAPETEVIQWRPDSEWLSNWKSRLVLGPFKVLIEYIDPKLDAYVSENPSASEEDLDAIVKRCTLVGLMGQHKITLRTLEVTNELETWLTVYTWVNHRQTLNYSKNKRSTFAGLTPKLFAINSSI